MKSKSRCVEYNLSSTPGVYTPGIVPWFQNWYRTEPRRAVIAFVATYAGLPRPVALALLKGKKGGLKTCVVGETLHVGFPKDCAPTVCVGSQRRVLS